MVSFRISFAFAAFSLLFVAPVIASDVVVLTADNFDKEVGQKRGALVDFYTPWCGHCKKLAPEYEKLATSFKRTKSVLIGKVDCEEHNSICSKYEISGYPTIQWFPEGSLKPQKYGGERTAEALAEHVNKEVGTNVKIVAAASSVVVLTSENFNEIVLDESKDALVKFYAPWCGHCMSLAPVYEQVATAFKMEEDVIIGKVNGDKYRDLSQKFDISGFPTLKFFPKDNKTGEDFEGGRDLDEFITFLNERCRTSRDGDGQLTPQAGKVNELESLVKEFVTAPVEDKESVYKQLEAEANKLTGSLARYGKIYVKVAKSYKDKGPDYARNETRRLDRLLAKSVNAAKVDEFMVKKNILSTFVSDL